MEMIKNNVSVLGNQNFDRDLLIAALNKNQVTFAQIAKTAESISNGTLKLKLDSSGKLFIFEYLGKKVCLEMNSLKLRGLEYLNDILISDIMTKSDLTDIYNILDQVQEDLLNKADKEHGHSITEVEGLTEELTGKLNVYYFPTFNGMISNYTSLSKEAIIFMDDSPESYTSSVTFKSGAARSLTFGMSKLEKDYLWTRFMNVNNWGNPSAWRKIPLLRGNDVIVTSNVKADNETRLVNVENGKADKEHTHENLAPVEHRHAINDVANLKNILNIKADIEHGHIISDVENLTDSLNNKANVNHTHLIADVENLTDTLNNKANVNHGHAIADVENLTSSLDSINTSISNINNKMTVDSTANASYLYKFNSNGNVVGDLTVDINNNEFKITIKYNGNCSYPIARIVADNNEVIHVPCNTYIDGGVTFYSVMTITNPIPILATSFELIAHEFSSGTNGEKTLGTFEFTQCVVPNPANDDKLITQSQLLNLIHPIGSIYTSMSPVSPSLLFGGQWEQIIDRFIYCANSSNQTGGSKKISVANLPPHSHAQYVTANPGQGNNSSERADWDYDSRNFGIYPQGINTGNTGGGTDYMPPYITAYCWHRVA